MQALIGQLDARTHLKAVPALVDAARQSLQKCDGQLGSNDLAAATLSAEHAMQSLRQVQRAYWDAAVNGPASRLASPITSPAAVSFDTLPSHWRLVDRLKAGRLGPNRIAGGDFEDMDTMMRAGWQYIPNLPLPTSSPRSAANLLTAVDLLPEAAHSGRLGLRLAVTARDPKNPPAAVESPPILFTSPAVQVEPGQIVCVNGWVQVPAPITGSSDGLLIVDSLSGEALAARIGKTKGWQRFALYRVAPQSGAMCVTFALTGLGEVRLDDVAIQVLEGPAVVSQR